MLRCPRCADPLVAVTPSSSSTCPAGSLCPHSNNEGKSMYTGGGIINSQMMPVYPNLSGLVSPPKQPSCCCCSMSSQHCVSHHHQPVSHGVPTTSVHQPHGGMHHAVGGMHHGPHIFTTTGGLHHQPRPHLFQEISRPSMSLALITTASSFSSASQASTPAFVIAGTSNPFDFSGPWLSTFPQFSPQPDISFPVSNTQEVLKTNLANLKESGWFYGDLSWQDSARILEGASVGTFLVRNSSDQRFLFSLSVQRKPAEGPTSVRIHFSNGKFRLDAEEKIRDLMPEFSSVLDLIAHYLSLSTTTMKNQVWVDNIGKQSPICLKQPMYSGEAPSLAHFSRLAINRSISHHQNQSEAVGRLGLPVKLSQYLEKYPHTI